MVLAQPITPHLWFDREAREAAEFYCGLFPDSRHTHYSVLRNTPSGDCELVSFSLGGQPFKAISAGPFFSINLSISFIVNFDPSRDPAAREHLDQLWAALGEGGEVLMPLQAYPFSERFGWLRDRYGLGWQLILSNPAGDPRPFITPLLRFTGANCGRAEAAGAFYRSVFPNSIPGQLQRWPANLAPEREGTVMYSDFCLSGTWLAAMDNAGPAEDNFNEAISLMVQCRDQAEIDRYWHALSAVPEAEQCGWCKDPFGVSWQIVPAELEQMMASGDEARIARVTEAFLQMKKFDLARLRAAYSGS